MVDRNSNETDKTQAALNAEVSSLLSDAADCELIEMYVSSASQAAVEALIRRHAPMVAGVIRRVMPKSSDADDAFQATFLVLLKSAKKIRKHSSIAAWLYGVAYRTACRARLRLHEKKTVQVDSTALPSQDYRDPLTRISEQFQLELLDRELQQLSSPIKETLIDHHLLGYTASEIADRMDVSISAVEGRLRRGRAALRHALSRRGVSFSVAAVLAAKYQSTCNAATSSPVSQLLQNDWFSHAIQNTSHVSVPKTLHSLASKDIATVTKALLPKIGLASTIAACSVAAISTPILLTAPSGRSVSSIMIGTANAEEPQANEIAFDGTAASSGESGASSGGSVLQAGDSFGTPISESGGAGFGSAAGSAAEAGGLGSGSVAFDAAPSGGGGAAGGPSSGSAAPGGFGSSGGGSASSSGAGNARRGSGAPGAYGASYGGDAPAPAGGPGASYGAGYSGGGPLPAGRPGASYGAGYGGGPQGGYGGVSGQPIGGGAPGGYGGGPGASGVIPGGPGGPGYGGMGTTGMSGAPTGPGSMMQGMGGGFGGGSGEGSFTRTYKNANNKKPEWLTRGEDTLNEAEAGREEVRAKLRTKVAPEFNNTPLTSVIKQLSESSGVVIGTSLYNPEIGGVITYDEPVTLSNVGSISLQRTLEILSASLGGDFTYIVEPEGVQLVGADSQLAKQRRYYELSYIASDDEELDKVQESISLLEDTKVVKVGSMLVITANETQHLKIEELLSQIARMPKENF